MAVYFSQAIQQSFIGSKKIVLLDWHITYGLLAVAFKDEHSDADGLVNFYSDEGEPLKAASIHRSVVTECLQWHPDKKIIAIGWQSGEITIYSDADHEIFEQSSIHRAAIGFLQWNKAGTKLVSGDKSGLLAVWKVDPRGQLHPIPLHQHRLQGPLTYCIMHVSTQPSDRPRPGDVSVLEAYSWQRKSEPSPDTNSICCFCANSEGTLYYLNNLGECLERFRVGGQVHSFFFSAEKQMLVVVTTDMNLIQFSLNIDGHISQTSKVKLSGRNKASQIIWTEGAQLASCSSENTIRFWDLENTENYALNIHQHVQAIPNEAVTCIDYEPKQGILAAATSVGNVVMWQWVGTNMGSSQADAADQWEFKSFTFVGAPVNQVKWGTDRQLLGVSCGDTVQILSEQVMNTHLNDEVSAVQVSPTEMVVECHKTGIIHSIKSDVNIKGVFVTKEHLAIWSGKKVAVYSFSQDKPQTRVAGSFNAETSNVAVYEQNLYITSKAQVEVRTFQGTLKQSLVFTEQEGSLESMTVSGQYLVVGTSAGVVKVWDMSRREPKALGSTNLTNVVPELSRLVSVNCNCNGSKVSILVQRDNGNFQLAIWDMESDVVRVFSPASLGSPSEEGGNPVGVMATLPDLTESALAEQKRLCSELERLHIRSHHWDASEPQLLVCMTRPDVQGMKHSSENRSTQKKGTERGPALAILFVTQDMHMVVNSIFPMETFYCGFLGVSVPYLYFGRKPHSVGVVENLGVSPSAPGSVVARQTMRDFVGLEQGDARALQAMLSFSFNSTVGNMDEAYKAIKLIKSHTVWENMAKMCVKTQRLDVAATCLGNMGNARAAKVVRESRNIPEAEARLAVLAVQLGMLAEAEQLYQKSKRYDLLSQFYQASGQWQKAIEVCELHDRLHLKAAYHCYGKYSEALGTIPAAINSYEQAGTHRFEVPRMLLDDPVELENYVMKSKDKSIRKWWAEYLESMGDFDTALQFYEAAKDYLSMVRILCFSDNLQRAIKVVEESGCKAAAYHIARKLSVGDKQDIAKAIYFYTKAQCYGPAIQLAKEHGFDDHLMNLALLSSQENMIDAAKYFEANSSTQDKAILLYHKAGEISKALELCFEHQQYEVLEQLAEDLSEHSDPAMVGRMAEFLMSHDQVEKALGLLVRTKRHVEALDLCMDKHITITEELAEKMTIQKEANESEADAKRKNEILEKLAECCMAQGSYHLATKKFTQAGNKTKAMKALLKSGDTEKIVFFAGVSRQKDVYVLAGNYLQTLEWRKDPEIMKNIISFYTKGKAMELLAGFYDACAQVEIDEYQNYQKALGALNEALNCLSKAKGKNQAAIEAKATFLKERMALVEKFANAQRLYREDPEESVRQCSALLDERSLDAAVRVGDVYALLIEHFTHVGNYQQAYVLMEELHHRLPTANLALYVNVKSIEAVHKALGIPLGRGIGGGVAHKLPGNDIEEESEGENVEEVEDEGA